MKLLIAAVSIFAGFATALHAETIVSVTQTSYTYRNQPVCTAVRMNPATFTALPSDACALATTSSSYGPDRITKNQYDAAGQLTDIIRAYGVTTANLFPATLQQIYAHYTYSNNGLKQTETDANNNTSTYVYDGFDRLWKLQYPSIAIGSGVSNSADYEQYGYDNNGNRTSWQRRDGQTFNYSYDNLNQETLKDVPGGTSADVYTTYDGLGRITYRHLGSTTGAGTQYWYDSLGEMTASTDMNGHSIWKGYAYHDGVATALVWPDGQGVNTDARDAAGRVITAYFGCCGLVAYTGTYDSLGRMTGLGRQGGSTTWGYDNLGRLTSMTNDLNGTTYDIGWTFDYNPTGQLYTSTASSTTYDYKETLNSTDSPTYDGLNRDVRLVGTTAACPSGGYDTRQNLICDSRQTPNRTFTYDVENRMLTGVSTSANVKMVYDPEGRLSKYSTDGGSNWYTLLYDGTRLIAYYDNSGAMVARFIHGDGVDNPLVWMVGSGTSNMRPLYTDYHGSVIADTDSAGTLTNLYKYGPYGEPKNISNAEYWDGSPFRYTGQIALPQLQLYYYKARVYDPKWGRFLQTDPIGSKDDLDLYVYVGGDPINKADPSGNAPPEEENWNETRGSENEPQGLAESIYAARIGSAVERARGAGARNFNYAYAGRPTRRGAEEAERQSEEAIATARNGRSSPPLQGSPALEGDPWSPPSVQMRVLPRYNSNPAHDPRSPLYNPAKDPEPNDAESVYHSTARRAGMGTWYGRNSKGDYYRYSYDNVNTVHYSGTIDPADVPNSIRKSFDD